jgi:hypothetical protein
MLSLPEGNFRFVVSAAEAIEGEREIRIQPLLLEVMRRRDMANR